MKSRANNNLNLSAFLCAVVLFFAANSIASTMFTRYKESVQDDFAALTLKKTGSKPNVVFAGSSTTLYPLYQLDCSRYGPQPMCEKYTRVLFAEDLLKKLTGQKVQVNNISFLGFMISDNLFVVRNYLTGEQAPQVLVLMVTPRDFCDSLMDSPASGIAFRKLADLSKTFEFCGTYLSEPNDYLDFLIGKGVFTVAIRPKIQDKLHAYLDNKWHAIQIANGAAVPKEEKWAKSVREYEIRYKNISFAKMHKQFVFLSRLLQTCQERDINVILVNSPLTLKSQSMLPPGLYQQYCGELSSIAHKAQIDYFDYANSKSPTFDDADFLDTVHLNEIGAHKVLSQILPKVSQRLRTELSLKDQASSL